MSLRCSSTRRGAGRRTHRGSLCLSWSRRTSRLEQEWPGGITGCKKKPMLKSIEPSKIDAILGQKLRFVKCHSFLPGRALKTLQDHNDDLGTKMKRPSHDQTNHVIAFIDLLNGTGLLFKQRKEEMGPVHIHVQDHNYHESDFAGRDLILRPGL